MTVADKKALRRFRLIEVAMADILDHGVETVSFRTLAKRAGTTTAPFTYEFGSRAKMLAAIVDRTWAWLEPENVGADATPLEMLKARSRRWTPIDDADVPFVNVYIDLTLHAVHNKPLAAHMAALNEEGDARWCKLVKEAQANGEIDSSIVPADLVAQLWALSDGLAVTRMSHSEDYTGAMVERVWSDAFDRLVGTKA
jgi:AcrR family transcriptional regulator